VLAALVDGSEVPRRRDDDLITLDLAVLDALGVVERAARSLPVMVDGSRKYSLSPLFSASMSSATQSFMRPAM
jgi:hypothetical protein